MNKQITKYICYNNMNTLNHENRLQKLRICNIIGNVHDLKFIEHFYFDLKKRLKG